jgi:hypothetical protein
VFNLDAGTYECVGLLRAVRPPLSEVAAVQSVFGGEYTTETPSGGQISLRTYQLNLVRVEGHRISVANIADDGWVRESARMLAVFLKVPLATLGAGSYLIVHLNRKMRVPDVPATTEANKEQFQQLVIVYRGEAHPRFQTNGGDLMTQPPAGRPTPPWS